jgi:hypothetical protein
MTTDPHLQARADAPIACTLTPDGMTARLAVIDALATDGLLDRTPTNTGLRVRLRDTPQIEQRIRELIASESKCCAFLDFTLHRDGGELVLDIAGAEDARPVIEMFFATNRRQDARLAFSAAAVAASVPSSASASADRVPGSAV